jgi:hypothetical protein
LVVGCCIYQKFWSLDFEYIESGVWALGVFSC